MNARQILAINEGINGHNLLILGQSGTGKSYLINEIKDQLKKRGKSVAITGTTGVASLNIGGITIHSWSGIADGHFSDEYLLQKLLTDEHFHKYKINIQNTDVLILDEISMLSAKLFNQVEYICRKIRCSDLYFGGIQVIGSGDFLQLPPVPDSLKQDPGDFCFKSDVFKSVFRHKILLEEVKRQDEADFVKAIHDISRGDLPIDTLNLLRRLQRPLPPGDKPIRLFARNFDREVYNASCLLDLEGDLKTFRSVDEGDIAKLKKIPVENTLHVKINCPVMLVKNLSQNLINGLQGVVQEIDIEMNTITVKFPDLVTEIKRETFTVYSSVENKVVVSRRQIPLFLSYGITIHKAQGLTMNRVEVDCSNIFKAGQLGVAIVRARKKKRLRLIDFHPRNVTKPDKSLFEFSL
jgi:ATP-dependent DNA helicase PIF1